MGYITENYSDEDLDAMNAKASDLSGMQLPTQSEIEEIDPNAPYIVSEGSGMTVPTEQEIAAPRIVSEESDMRPELDRLDAMRIADEEASFEPTQGEGELDVTVRRAIPVGEQVVDEIIEPEYAGSDIGRTTPGGEFNDQARIEKAILSGPTEGYRDQVSKLNEVENNIRRIKNQKIANILENVPRKLQGRSIQYVEAQASQAMAALATHKDDIGNSIYTKLDTNGRFKADAIQEKYGVDMFRAAALAQQDTQATNLSRMLLNRVQDTPQYAPTEAKLFGTPVTDPTTGRQLIGKDGQVVRKQDGLVTRDEMGILTITDPSTFAGMVADVESQDKYKRSISAMNAQAKLAKGTTKDPMLGQLDYRQKAARSEMALQKDIMDTMMKADPETAKDDPRYKEARAKHDAASVMAENVMTIRNEYLNPEVTKEGALKQTPVLTQSGARQVSAEIARKAGAENELNRLSKAVGTATKLGNAYDNARIQTQLLSKEAAKSKEPIFNPDDEGDVEKLLKKPPGIVYFKDKDSGAVTVTRWDGPKEWAKQNALPTTDIKEMGIQLDEIQRSIKDRAELLKDKYPSLTFSANGEVKVPSAERVIMQGTGVPVTVEETTTPSAKELSAYNTQWRTYQAGLRKLKEADRAAQILKRLGEK
ncbi:MAG: hypothetical protein WCL08_00090 [Verrucomicrobiota bacterium]